MNNGEFIDILKRFNLTKPVYVLVDGKRFLLDDVVDDDFMIVLKS